MTEKWISVAEMAAKLGVGESSIRRRINAGKLESKREGQRVYVLDDGAEAPDGVGSEAKLVEALERQIDSLERQLEVANKRDDQSQQIIAVQTQNLGKLTDQNQKLLAAAEPEPSLMAKLAQLVGR